MIFKLIIELHNPLQTKRETLKNLKRKIYPSHESPPSIDHLGVCVLDPPKAFPQWSFHLALHSVNLVPSNSLLPLQFWVIEAPVFRDCPNIAFPFLHLQLLWYYLVICLYRWTCIIHTVRPQILHACWGTSSSIVALNLHHPPIPAWLGSEILHEGTGTSSQEFERFKNEWEN